ncbi:hypothetical protein HDU85_007668 [Gaertneriomyces sp. JEL0708]|nr:hypothetical protein HDU85_007668 [Gaertneriomyces sp. JEL0708]
MNSSSAACGRSKSRKPSQNEVEAPRHLRLADEFNGVLTYMNPGTHLYYAFCRNDQEPPTFLPALSKILYNTTIPGDKIIVAGKREKMTSGRYGYPDSSRKRERSDCFGERSAGGPSRNKGYGYAKAKHGKGKEKDITRDGLGGMAGAKS